MSQEVLASPVPLTHFLARLQVSCQKRRRSGEKGMRRMKKELLIMSRQIMRQRQSSESAWHRGRLSGRRFI